MNKFIAFDIETLKEIPEGEDWKDHRPLGISCASTLISDDPKPLLWYRGQPLDPLPDKMHKLEVMHLVKYIETKSDQGYIPLSWNGTGFDFQILAEESGYWDTCRKLAIDHIDMMYQVLCIKGFPIGLEAACIGMGLGKKKGMHGIDAPDLWANGSLADRMKVLEYVGHDSEMTMGIANKAIESHNQIRWITKKGQPKKMRVGEWKSVRECQSLPLPDTSWMSSPLLRESFTEWIDTTSQEI